MSTGRLAGIALGALAAVLPAHAQHHPHHRRHQEHAQHGAADACTPEHAAMGHCTLPPAASHGGPVPGAPVPPLSEADRAAAFPTVAHHAMTHASPVSWKVSFERLEAWDADPGSGQLWEVDAWIGGDVHRLWLKSEGSRSGGRTGNADLELLLARGVTAWWDVLAGVRQETRPSSRSWAAVGIDGVAPGPVEVSAMAYVGSGGQVQLKAEANYDIRFSNRLILQPLLELVASLEDEPAHGIGRGLGTLEAGLRLRYEIDRQFAPYVGIVHHRALGTTADHARAAGDDSRDTRIVAGLRAWF